MTPASGATIAIIPARGGSKGLPGKNIIDYCGHPLLAWSISAARQARGIDRVIVSTDDRAIEQAALRYGAEVIIRPNEISGDTATSESALLHVLDVIQAQGGLLPDRVIFLQATSPLREPCELEGALELFEREGLDSLFAGAAPEDLCLWRERTQGLESVNYDYKNRRRRQDGGEAFRLWVETGSFYITKGAVLRQASNRLAGKIGIYPVPFWKSHEIDSLEDLELCAMLARHHKLKPPVPAA